MEKKKVRFLAPKPLNSSQIDKNSDLMKSRKEITAFSLRRAAKRIHSSKIELIESNYYKIWDNRKKEVENMSKFKLEICEVGDKRPLSSGKITPCGNYYVTSSWSGICKIWDIRGETASVASKMTGHSFQVFDVDYHPTFLSNDKGMPNIVTCGGDCTVKLWTFDLEKEKQNYLELRGHQDRVNRARFHPDGLHLISCSYDKTLTHWDIEKEKMLCRLKGHNDSVYSCCIHPDGSLIFSGDLEGVGVIWDLRSGKPIMPLNGHHSSILSSDFSNDGYHLATGSKDNTVKIWDLRRRKSAYTLPLHKKAISDVKYQESYSSYLVTASHDGFSKIVSCSDYLVKHSLEMPKSRVSSLSISPDELTLCFTTMEKKWYKFKRKGPMEVEQVESDDDDILGDQNFLADLLQNLDDDEEE